MEISRLVVMKCFESEGSNFIIDPRRNGKPVKGTKNRSNGMETTGCRNNYTSKRVLDKLEATNGMKRETKEKGIAVVKFSGNKHWQGELRKGDQEQSGSGEAGECDKRKRDVLVKR